jgi:hypothetical protein
MTAVAIDLEDYVWRNRLLILAAPESSDPEVVQVRDKLEHHAEELVDRDLLVFQLFVGWQSLIGDQPITPGQAERLRAKLGIDTGEKVMVLVGKDGGAKRRAPLLTDLQHIFRQIDAMPMRRDEMREQGHSGAAAYAAYRCAMAGVAYHPKGSP